MTTASTTEPRRDSDTVHGLVVLPPDPPDGFRLLTEGERIRKGDIYCKGVGHSWHETRNWSGKWTSLGCWPMARKHNTGREGTRGNDHA